MVFRLDKGTGGSWVIFASDIQMKIPIAGVSKLLQNENISLYEENMTVLIFRLPYFPIIKLHAKWSLESAN